jgi:receptor kinase-like protein
VLEMVTGKRPTDSKFTQGQSLREYAELGLHGKVLHVTDPRLSSCLETELQTTDSFSHREKVDSLISLLRLGVSRSHETPSNRMSIGDIIKQLHDVKENLVCYIY